MRGIPERDPTALSPAAADMAHQAQKVTGLPVVGGNSFELIGVCETLVDRLVADIDAATSSVHLLYYIFFAYIFFADTTGDRVAAALERARARGVDCRVLMDAVASRHAFHRHGLARRLRPAGVRVVPALPVDWLRRGIGRMDFRNHRKLALIDGRTAYCGSHNLINPDYGGRRGAPWVDLTARITGPVVAQLAGVFAEDWAFETGDEIAIPPVPPSGNIAPEDTIPAQTIATGPGPMGETYRRVLLAAVGTAREQVTLTSPYFVPDEPTLVALQMAVDRGVRVTLALPETGDQFFAAAAGRAHYATLLRAGVALHLYRPGLLHAKTTTVDDAFALIGSANLDLRSFHLNFELGVLLYGPRATNAVRRAQAAYVADSRQLTLDEWTRRPVAREYADRAVSLLSPLL